MPTKPLKTKPDTFGWQPPLSLLGSRWKHYKGGTYDLVDFVWDATRDKWMIAYKAPHSNQVFVRTQEDFFSTVMWQSDPVSPRAPVNRFVETTTAPRKR